MTATGRISDDLPAIKEILDQRGGPKYYEQEAWWGSPSSQQALSALADTYDELPQDVIDFYGVTGIAFFGCFADIVGPERILSRSPERSPYSEAQQESFPFIFEENVPQGHDILPMSLEPDWGCLIELGGPDHGRVIHPPFNGNYWRTLAWSLSDAVACIRDLYEFGWYQFGPEFQGQKMSPSGRPTDEGLAELAKVQPILDRWNCNPVIARFHDPYGYEPKRPNRN